MSENTFPIRVKKEYAAALIADLIKVNAVEAVEEDDAIELTTQQKSALDKELASIAGKNVRCKPMKRFPFLSTFTIDEAAQSVNILRVFNIYLKPLH